MTLYEVCETRSVTESIKRIGSFAFLKSILKPPLTIMLSKMLRFLFKISDRSLKKLFGVL